MKINLFSDPRLSQEHLESGLDGVITISQKGFGTDSISSSEISGSVFFNAWNRERQQINAAILLANIECDEKVVVLTTYDLYVEGTNFVFGLCVPELGAIVSSCRVSSKTFRSLVAHETGHLKGLVPEYRKGISSQELFGLHCLNFGCVMRQGLTLAEWDRYSHEIIEGEELCIDCQRDLLAASYYSSK